MQIIALAGGGTAGNTIGDANTYVTVDTSAKTITLVVNGTVQQVWS